MAFTQEPEITKHTKPEYSLQCALKDEIQAILSANQIKYILLEGFGLDLAVFIDDQRSPYTRFIEVKADVGQRAGGVGVGNSNGKATQIDLLLNPPDLLQMTTKLVHWVLGFGNLKLGQPRYAFFDCQTASRAIMGQIRRGKQNNLRLNDFKNQLLTWDELSIVMTKFLKKEINDD